MCAEKGDPDFTLPAETAVKFAENCTALGLEGGVVVCAYEEGLPQQAVAQGDIIYEVDGAAVRSFSEYSAAVDGDGTHAVRILRFGANGHELLEGIIDNSLGRIALLGLNDDQDAEAEERG